ncbi:MAG: glycosyltransferase family 4 protein [Thermoplasmata archaeon]|nr:MAG: glycosyltransferase family 4 protein [Thermoplasmata archaeon]
MIAETEELPSIINHPREQTSISADVQKMKSICLVNLEYPPLEEGGLANHVYELANAISELKRDTHVICGQVKDLNRSYKANDNLTIHRVKWHRMKGTDFLSYSWNAYRKLKELDKSSNCDYIHLHSPYGYVPAIFSDKLSKPMVVKIHNIYEDLRRDYYPDYSFRQRVMYKYGIFRFFAHVDRKMIKKAKIIITTSKWMKQRIVDVYGVNPNKIHVIYNGVNTVRFNPNINGKEVRKKYEITDNDFVVLFVGRLTKRKGIDSLMEIVPRVIRKKNDIKFVIVGSETYEGKGALEKMKTNFKKENCLKNVIFTGWIPMSYMGKYYAACDLLYHPPLHEPFGNVVVEAMSCGKPAIALKGCGGPEETIRNGKTGYILDNNLQVIADKIVELSENRILKAQLSQNARTHMVNNFNWFRTAQNTIKVLESVE